MSERADVTVLLAVVGIDGATVDPTGDGGELFILSADGNFSTFQDDPDRAQAMADLLDGRPDMIPGYGAHWKFEVQR